MKKLIILSSAFLLILFTLLQSGCLKDSENTEYPDVTASADTINGIVKYKQTDTSGTKVVDWHFGAAVIKVIVGGSDEISSAIVNADGRFTLILPATLPGSYFSSLAEVATQQGGTIKCTPETVRFHGSNQYKVEYTENGDPKSMMINLYTLNADLSVDKSYFFNFYDLDGTFTGTGTKGNKFNWTFTKGWGMVENHKLSSASDAFESNSVNLANPDAIWVN